MPIRVAKTGRDHRDLGPHRLEERLGARGLRAVVGDLQELDPGQPPDEQLGIHVLLDIASEQEPVRPEAAEQDDRDVVDRRAAVGGVLGHPARIGPQDPELDLVELEPVTRRQGAVGRLAGSKRCRPRPVARARPDHARLVHPPDLVAAEELRKPGYVVLVRVREDEDVDPAVPRRQALIERTDQPSRIGAAIDEESPPGATLDEDPVTLPDVEDRDAHDARRSFGHGEAERDRRGCQGDCGDSRSSAALARDRGASPGARRCGGSG